MESASALWGVCWGAREAEVRTSLALTLSADRDAVAELAVRVVLVAHRVPLWLFYLVLYIVRDVVDICIF